LALTPPPPKKRTPEAEFGEEFWPAYPRKVARKEALLAFAAARKRAKLDEILRRLDTSKRVEWDGRDVSYIPHPATWLRREDWEAKPEASAPVLATAGPQWPELTR
jgi:hypothetical protein